MTGYVFKLIKRNLLINIFIAFQLAVTLVMIIMCVSSVMSRVEYYLPLKSVLSSDGICLFAGEYYIDSGYTYSYENIQSVSENIDKIYSCESISFLSDPNYEESPTYIVYNENMYNLCKPKMQEGKWLSDAPENDESISVVVGHSSRYNVGDIIEMYESIDEVYYSFKVIGKTAKGAKFISNSSESVNKRDFRDLYDTVSSDMMFVKRDDIDNTNLLILPCGVNFITYKNGLSGGQISEINSGLYSMGSYLKLSEELNKNSMAYISEDIILILPICICVMIISLICTIASSAVTTKNNMRTYLIAYICGSEWQSNALISLANSAVNILCGIILAAGGYILALQTRISERLCLNFSEYELAFCLPVVLLYLIVPVIMPLWSMSRQTPKELLAKE